MLEYLIGRGVMLVALGGAGALFIWLARAAASGRLKRNPIAGIRTTSTMASEEAWRAGHTRAKRSITAAGIAAIVAGLLVLLPMPSAAVGATVLAGCAVLLGFLIYGTRVAGRAAQAVTDSTDA